MNNKSKFTKMVSIKNVQTQLDNEENDNHISCKEHMERIS